MVPGKRGQTMSDTISIVGNVATDPRRNTPNGVAITSFRLAVSQRRLDKATGEWVDGATNWYSVSAFRALGDHALHSIKKGDRVFVSGRLRIRDWTAGEKSGTSAEVEAESLGHDLLWGTTTFTKAGSVVSRAVDAQTSGASRSGGDEWHVPMGDAALSAPASGTAAAAAGEVTDQSLQALLDDAAALDDDEPAMAMMDASGLVTPF